MSITFPFVEVSKGLFPLVGEPTPGTRTYRRHGSYEQSGEWFDSIGEHFGGCVSPGGVSMFAPVSRAAVHQRLKQGKLTAFTFYVVHNEKSLFGTERKAKERPYVMIPTSECKAWAEDLKRRTGYVDEQGMTRDKEREHLRIAAIAEEPTTEKEVREGDEFLERDPKDKGNKKVVYKEVLTREEIIGLVCQGRKEIPAKRAV
jgi:hypothetical protein